MQPASFILFADEDHWRIAAVSAAETRFVDVSLSTPAVPAELVAAAIRPLGYTGQGAMLAIPAHWCLSASIQTDDLPRGDAKAMLYRLEEKLPVSAEDIAADFTSSEPTLGISASLKQLKPLVESLEQCGVTIASITPAVLAAAQALLPSEEKQPVVLIAQETDAADAQLNVLTLKGGKLVNWALLARDARDVKLELKMIAINADTTLRYEAIGVRASMPAAVVRRTETVHQAAARFGAAMLAGSARPWIELRQGPLAIQDRLRQHRPLLNRLLAAAVILLVVSTAATILRAQRYARLADGLNQQMVDGFRTTFPGWPVPANIKAVVEAEHRKAAGASGQPQPLDTHGSAMKTLHDVLTRFPTAGRYSLDHLSFEADTFQIEGRLRSYEQSDALAAAARDAGLDVPTPVTRKGDDGSWSFTLRGNRPVADPSVAVKGTR